MEKNLALIFTFNIFIGVTGDRLFAELISLNY